jgi:hypothetical protein
LGVLAAITINAAAQQVRPKVLFNFVTGSVQAPPRQTATLSVKLHPSGLALTEPLELIGMRGYPMHDYAKLGHVDVEHAFTAQRCKHATRPTCD